MPEPLIVALAHFLDLWDGCVIRVAALDPDTGDVVPGVNVSDVTLQVVALSGDLEVGPWQLVTGPQS